MVVSWSRPGPSITVEGRRVVTGRLALEGARRLALGDHVVEVGLDSWQAGWRREDADVQLDEAPRAKVGRRFRSSGYGSVTRPVSCTVMTWCSTRLTIGDE